MKRTNTMIGLFLATLVVIPAITLAGPAAVQTTVSCRDGCFDTLSDCGDAALRDATTSGDYRRRLHECAVDYCGCRRDCVGANKSDCTTVFKTRDDVLSLLPLILFLEAGPRGGPQLVPRKLSCASGLVIRIENTGSVDAGPSTTRVEVLATVPIPLNVSTPGIPAKGFVDLGPLSLPSFCVAGGCNIKITADLNNEIHESNENDNVINERCP